MSISDWSSDVCSSDLDRQRRPEGVPGRPAPYQAVLAGGHREGGDVVAQRQAVVAPPGLDEAAEQDHDVDHRREAGPRQGEAEGAPGHRLGTRRKPSGIALPGHGGVGLAADPAELRIERSAGHPSELQSLMRNSYAALR